ncbi:MAG: hypothetical protein ACYCS9_07820 [Candidatus Dormibacteria bacterium]
MPTKVGRRTTLITPVMVLLGLALASLTPASTPTRAGLGSVTGFMDACSGLPVSPLMSPYAFGTVRILKGRIRWTRVAPGQWRESLPTEVVAMVRVTPEVPFQFAVRPGEYVLEGNYGHGSNVYPAVPVKISRGRSSRVDIPNQCT